MDTTTRVVVPVLIRLCKRKDGTLFHTALIPVGGKWVTAMVAPAAEKAAKEAGKGISLTKENPRAYLGEAEVEGHTVMTLRRRRRLADLFTTEELLGK